MSYEMIMFEAGSMEWLDARVQNVTATEIASLFSLNKHKSPAALIKDKFDPQFVWTNWIRRGRILEPAVIEAMREDLGWAVDPICEDGKVGFYKHHEHRLSATPDAKLIMDGETYALIECKTASDIRIEDWDFTVPTNYLLQVHAQMICTNIKKAYIACLGAFDPFPLIVYEVKWHEELNELLKHTVDMFWESVDETGKFKANKDDKKRVKEWLPDTVKRIY